MFHTVPDVAKHDFKPPWKVRDCCRSVRQSIQSLGKDPGVADSSPPNHHAIAARPVLHPDDIIGAEDVAVTDDRNRERLFDVCDDGPVRLAAKSLNGCPGMQDDSVNAAGLRQTGSPQGLNA